MGILDKMFRRKASSPPEGRPQAFGLNSPEFYEFVRTGGNFGVNEALKNSAVLRAVDLVSGTIGALPLRIIERQRGGRIVEAEDHPLYRILMMQPNGWQTAFEFRQLMQVWVLIHGNAYARIVRGVGNRVVALLPIDPQQVTVEQQIDGSVLYRMMQNKGAAPLTLAQDSIFHLRGISTDGLTGISRVKQAADVIQTAVQAQLAARNLFNKGVVGGMALEHPGKLSADARDNLKESVDRMYAGADNAFRTMVLEEGMKRSFATVDAESLQLTEMTAALVEHIARIFGIPRPLMMVDETSWGSGVEQLAILFVRFGLTPWFVAWEQAVERSLMSDQDRRLYRADYDERELLRGTLKDQADYFAKALGAGGHRPWMEANEVRELSGLGAHADGSGLVAAGEDRNDPSQTAG